MVALVRVSGELVHAFGHTVLQTVLTILVIDSFHLGVRQHLISLAKLGEFLVGLCLLLTWISQWMVLQCQLSVSSSDLLTVGSRSDLKRFIIPCLIVVHLILCLLAVSA